MSYVSRSQWRGRVGGTWMRNQRFRVGGTQRVDLVRWVHEGSPLATRYPSSRDATVGTARMPPFLRSCP
eukprot:gene19677-biopygen19064